MSNKKIMFILRFAILLSLANVAYSIYRNHLILTCATSFICGVVITVTIYQITIFRKFNN